MMNSGFKKLAIAAGLIMIGIIAVVVTVWFEEEFLKKLIPDTLNVETTQLISPPLIIVGVIVVIVIVVILVVLLLWDRFRGQL